MWEGEYRELMAEKVKLGLGKGLFTRIHLGAVSVAGDRVLSCVGEGYIFMRGFVPCV